VNTKLLLMVGAAALAVAGGAARAGETGKTGPGTWIVAGRLTGVISNADDAITAGGAPTGLKVDVKADYKPTLGITYFFTDKIAADLTLGTTQHDVSAKGVVQVYKTWVLPPVLTVQYHFNPNGAFRPYVGTGPNYMLFYSGKNKNGYTTKLKDGFGWALQAGANVPMSGAWMLNADVKKVFFETDARILTPGATPTTLNSKVHLDPWVVSLGVSRQF
jgi:outer membrane protein